MVEADSVGIATNAQEPVERSVVESSGYFGLTISKLPPLVKRTTIETEFDPIQDFQSTGTFNV
ncbi:MAG: hypothetical protein E7813_24095 [Bradyrhizobium sp.]|uniref:hypothetical protein n=1 Tax=Bradyrhizobium sp. TaxID=376 RepID=UPI0011FA508B|nr:hypothetical protein [Bradyrhizobium sp.]THD60054.1 MAG: hypothetical protein E7813_24095 [Bradyrhizobium sp.]